MTGDIIAALIASVGGVVVALVGIYGARKLGIGQSQERLIATLNDLVEANEKKVIELEKQISIYIQRIAELEQRVVDLEKATIDQALEIVAQQNEISQLSGREYPSIPPYKKGGGRA